MTGVLPGRGEGTGRHRTPCEDRGRGWSDAATGPNPRRAAASSPQTEPPCLSGFRPPYCEAINCCLSHPLSQQSQDTNTMPKGTPLEISGPGQDARRPEQAGLCGGHTAACRIQRLLGTCESACHAQAHRAAPGTQSLRAAHPAAHRLGAEFAPRRALSQHPRQGVALCWGWGS